MNGKYEETKKLNIESVTRGAKDLSRDQSHILAGRLSLRATPNTNQQQKLTLGRFLC